VFLLQEVEDWYLELGEREPGLVDKVNAGSGRADGCGSHQGIDAPQPQELRPTRGATHFRILFVFELNAKRCFWWPATRPGTAGQVRHEDPDRRVSLRPMDQETGGRMSEKKPTARPRSAEA
jgi:hypothetical protein